MIKENKKIDVKKINLEEIYKNTNFFNSKDVNYINFIFNFKNLNWTDEIFKDKIFYEYIFSDIRRKILKIYNILSKKIMEKWINKK